MAVTLTEKAESRLRTFLLGSTPDSKAPTNKGIRVSAKDGGCNGYEYGMEVTSSPKPDDVVLLQGNVLIYLDAKSAPLLEGMVIDFVEGVMESGFKFTALCCTLYYWCYKVFFHESLRVCTGKY